MTNIQIVIICEKIIKMQIFKLSKENQELIDNAIKAKIKLENLIEKYGIRFVLDLLKDTQKDELSVYLSYPRTKNKNKEKFQEKYEKELLDAGFKFHDFKDDFVDEDTGQVVSIDRKNIYCIKLKKKKKHKTKRKSLKEKKIT